MSDKENLKWVAVGFVVGACTNTLYDLLKEIFLANGVSHIDSITRAGLVSLAIGLGFIAYYAVIKNSKWVKDRSAQ